MCVTSTDCLRTRHHGAHGSGTLTRSFGSGADMQRMSRTEWILLLLLITSIFINYIDRSNLSIAAPLLQKELSLSPSALGSLLSSFFWTYALLQLFGVAGWLADRFPVGLVLAGGGLAVGRAPTGTGVGCGRCG